MKVDVAQTEEGAISGLESTDSSARDSGGA